MEKDSKLEYYENLPYGRLVTDEDMHIGNKFLVYRDNEHDACRKGLIIVLDGLIDFDGDYTFEMCESLTDFSVMFISVKEANGNGGTYGDNVLLVPMRLILEDDKFMGTLSGEWGHVCDIMDKSHAVHKKRLKGQ